MRQFSKTQRRLAVGAFLLTAAPVALGSVAYACQSLATLHANPKTAAAGGSVTVFGRNYSTAAGATPVEIHLNGRSGPVIASFTPTGTTREINGSVTIPNTLAAGTHTLVATQYLSSGDAVSGTPGRASIQVTVAGKAAGEGSTATPVAAPSTDTAAPAAAAAATTREAVTPGAAPSASASASAPAASVAAPTAASGAAAPAVAEVATTGAATAAPTAALAPAAPDAATSAPAAAAPTVTSSGSFLPAASSDSTSALPGLTLAVGLALVLLSLGAFVKSGRTVLGGRGFTPLAG